MFVVNFLTHMQSIMGRRLNVTDLFMKVKWNMQQKEAYIFEGSSVREEKVRRMLEGQRSSIQRKSLTTIIWGNPPPPQKNILKNKITYTFHMQSFGLQKEAMLPKD